MRPRPYLRAYMAGIVVPTLFLLVVAAVDAYQKYYFEVSNQFVIPLASRPLERAIAVPDGGRAQRVGTLEHAVSARSASRADLHSVCSEPCSSSC